MKKLPLFLLFLGSFAFLTACWDNQSNFEHQSTRTITIDHDYENADSSYADEVKKMEDKNRVIWQKPDAVIDILGNLEEKTVADIGSGSGFFSFRLALEAKKVIAIDIDPRALAYMDSLKQANREKFTGEIELRLAPPGDPMLLPQETDAVLVVNTYIFIDDRIEYFKKVRNGMPSGGKLLIIDYKTIDIVEGYPPPMEYRMTMKQVAEELIEAGFRISELDDETLDYQYMILAMNP